MLYLDDSLFQLVRVCRLLLFFANIFAFAPFDAGASCKNINCIGVDSSFFLAGFMPALVIQELAQQLDRSACNFLIVIAQSIANFLRFFLIGCH